MRTILFALAVLGATAAINTQPAAAQQPVYPWCAEMYDGATECVFQTRQQCEADVSGLGGYCYENPANSDSTSRRAPR
jgi:Protein of unknown function (DUF3551)